MEHKPTLKEHATDYAIRSGWSESGKELDTAESVAIEKAYICGAKQAFSMLRDFIENGQMGVASAWGRAITEDSLLAETFKILASEE